MNPIVVEGIGAVSPAGWTVGALRDALAKGLPLPVKNLVHPGLSSPLPIRAVPVPPNRPSFLTHPRLRRSSPITHFAVSAALEAVGHDLQAIQEGRIRLGLIFCVMAGCVNYSRRFFDETLRDPATASPLLFPETVFNAPVSHLSAFFGSTHLSYTLVGDPGMFLVGLAIAAQWLHQNKADGCLVIGAEEIDWTVADASRRFQRRALLGEGAGAVYLTARPARAGAIQMSGVTEAHSFLRQQSRAAAAMRMRAELPGAEPETLLVDSCCGVARIDRAEQLAWADWRHSRLSVKPVLGDGLAASSAWQTVAALDRLPQEDLHGAIVSVVGHNQQAIGAWFERMS
jgi:hypothetical protein